MALPAGSYQPAEVTYLDGGNEKASMRFYGVPLTAANHDAKVALWATLLSALDAVALGARSKDVYNDESVYSVTQPTNGCMRETKLLIQFQDTTNGKKMTTSLPTLDISKVTTIPGATDAYALDEPTEIVDLIAAFEAFATNPEQPTHAVVVTGIRGVGRNT